MVIEYSKSSWKPVAKLFGALLLHRCAKLGISFDKLSGFLFGENLMLGAISAVVFVIHVEVFLLELRKGFYFGTGVASWYE